MSDVTDTDRESQLGEALGPVLDMARTDYVAGPSNRAHWVDRLVAAVKRAGWRPGGAPVAPTREALAEHFYMVTRTTSLSWGVLKEIVATGSTRHDYLMAHKRAYRDADALLASGLFGERREDVQAEALETAASVLPYHQIEYGQTIDWLRARAAELRKAVQS